MPQNNPLIVESLVLQFLSKDGFVDAPAVAAIEANPGMGLRELIDKVIAQAVHMNATVKF